MRRVALCLLALAAAGCGGTDDALTVYLPQRLGPEGPKGQRVPVLMPVERDRRETMSAVRQAVLEVMGGPAPGERSRGFLETIPLATRLVDVEIAGDLATVELAGAEPSYLGAAAIVYSVTEQTGVQRVRLRLDGEPCCVFTHQATAWPGALDRRTFRGWTGEPCPLRIYAHAVRCRIR